MKQNLTTDFTDFTDGTDEEGERKNFRTSSDPCNLYY